MFWCCVSLHFFSVATARALFIVASHGHGGEHGGGDGFSHGACGATNIILTSSIFIHFFLSTSFFGGGVVLCYCLFVI